LTSGSTHLARARPEGVDPQPAPKNIRARGFSPLSCPFYPHDFRSAPKCSLIPA
jgi:hypothetical protein